jgi:hypothetical protein
MFRKTKHRRLELEIIESKIIKSTELKEITQVHLRTNKPIPPAKHGTVCLRGRRT